MYALVAKVKVNATLKAWGLAAFAKAAEMQNQALDMEFERAASGERLMTAFDLATAFRSFDLGSDYKDQIADRVASATSKWYSSESLRYQIYWKNLEKHQEKPEVEEDFEAYQYPFLVEVSRALARRNDYRRFVKSLSQKQKLIGRPRKKKLASLAFSIRKQDQKRVKIKEKTLEIVIPKFGRIKGKHNRLLPESSNFLIKKATLKMDSCGDFWLSVIVDGSRPRKDEPPKPQGQRTIVGIDLGLKNLRTAVAVDETTLEKKEVYQPERQRYFDKSYKSLVQAYRKDRKAIPFVYRKITRRRKDNIGKDVEKIINMGDLFKIGRLSSSFLFSGRLARSAADAANSLFVSCLVKRALLAGKDAGYVDEAYTSVTCRCCGTRRKMKLSDRVFVCTKCKHEEDRDENSAYNIAVTDENVPKRRASAPDGKTSRKRRGTKSKATIQAPSL
jgi:putative transposase